MSQHSASRNDFSGTGYDILHLKTEACPSGFILTSTMDAKNRAAYVEFGDVIVLAGHFAAENIPVEGNGTWRVFCPDDVFNAFDFH
jgi:hypothetical protein